MTLTETRQLVVDLWNAGPAACLVALRKEQAARKLPPHELAEVVNLTALSMRVREATRRVKKRGNEYKNQH